MKQFPHCYGGFIWNKGKGRKWTKKIIAYDLGTGGNKASLYNAEGICLSSTFYSYDTFYPQDRGCMSSAHLIGGIRWSAARGI